MEPEPTKAFCTICNLAYLPYVKALAYSLQKQDAQLQLHVLVVDAEPHQLPASVDNLIYYDLSELHETPYARLIIKKYGDEEDILRWALKPVWMIYLLNNGVERLYYADGDLYFYESVDFLWEELNKNNVVVCPHWRIKEPDVNEDWFLVNFTDGVYNAGFVGANTAGKAAIDWWAMACAYKCKKDHKHGLHDDQKYLDLIPAAFEKVGILQHRGCNVAFWNLYENNRMLDNGKVLINGKWPVVFIHFTKDLKKNIKKGKDGALKPHLDEYKAALLRFS